MGIKRILERFIALPVSVFRNRMDKVEKRIQSLDKKLTKEKLELERLLKQQSEQQEASIKEQYQQGQDELHKQIEEQQRQKQEDQRQIQAEFQKQTELSQQQIQQQKELGQQQKELSHKQKEFGQQQIDLSKKQMELTQQQGQQQESQLRAVEVNLNQVDKRHDYKVGYELGVIGSFYDAYEEPNFKEKFLRLTSGMAKEEVAKIVCILKRQRIIKDQKGVINLYTPEEQAAIKHMVAYRESHTFQVQDDLFCYDGYFLPRMHFEVSVFYFKHGIEDLSENSRNFVKGKSIIDVGGFYGDSVLVLEELEPKSIYTFEAIQENYDILQETMQLNNIDNCVAEKLALGDSEGEITFDICGSQSNMQTLNYLNRITGTETAQLTTLDKYMENHEMEIGLIKVDIEGAEQAFLRGAKETICKHKPVLLMSIYHNADDFFDIKPIIESWDLGYKFKIHKPCDFTVSREVLLICEC